MRPFEFLILILLLLIILSFFFLAESHPTWVVFLPIAVAILLLIHLFIEGYRWQMVPAYFLAAIILLYSFITAVFNTPTPVRIVGIIVGVLLLFVFIIAVTLPAIFPIFQLPKPTGLYPVGTTIFTVSNEDHEVVVQGWYPAKSTSGQPNPYLDHASFPWDWLRHIQTNAYLNAPIADKQTTYPVLFFGHGGGFMAVQNTIQMEELASHGYIIFSISHPAESAITVYPDGHTTGRSILQAWKDMKPVLADNNAAFLLTDTLRYNHDEDNKSLDEKRVIMRQVFEKHVIALDVINRRVNDTYAVIDYLEEVNTNVSDLPFADRLDMDQLGVFGHSNGGAVAVNVAMNDSRIKAVINMDGYIFGDVFDTGLQQPFMSMNKDGRFGRDDVVIEQAKSDVYTVTIKGANHFNFMDIYLYTPWFNSMYLGTIDPQRAVEITNQYTLAFFDKHLGHKEVKLLDGPAHEYPEVILNK